MVEEKVQKIAIACSVEEAAILDSITKFSPTCSLHQKRQTHKNQKNVFSRAVSL